jgi:hypothetical protein
VKLKAALFFSVVLVLHNRDALSQILIGPVAGANIGWVTFDNKDNKDFYEVKPVFGFHVGASLAFRVQKRFFLQTSFLYQQRGKNLEGKVEQDFSNKVTYRYIDVPILYTAEFKAKVGKAREFKWYLGAGPTISYWLGGKGTLKDGDLNENLINPPNYDLPYKITFEGDPEEINEDEMNVQDPNRIQLGLNISAGLIFEPMGLHKIMFTTRYHAGHSFFSRDTKGVFGLPNVLYYEDDLRVRNQEIVLSLHYFIDLKTDQRKRGKSTIKMKKGQPRK